MATLKVIEIDWDWIASCTVKLKKKRIETFIQLWHVIKIINAICESLIILDYCFNTPVKSKELWNLDKPIRFLEHWHKVDKYVKEIFVYL